MVKSEETLDTLRLDLANAQRLQRKAEHRVAELEGQLNDGQHADLAQLRQQLTDAQVARDVETSAANDLRARLADLTNQLTNETARADRAALDAATTRKLNVDLTAVVQVLKQTVVVPAPTVVPASRMRDNITQFTPWYKQMGVWAIAGSVALAVVLVFCGVKFIPDMFRNNSATASAPVVEQVKPAVPAPASVVVPFIRLTNTPKSSCPFSSLNVCVDEMARRLGLAPSDASIRKYGTYSCQRIGCR